MNSHNLQRVGSLVLWLLLVGAMPTASVRTSNGTRDVGGAPGSPPASEQHAALAAAYGQWT
jgi:hypothetical protein